MLVQVRSAQTQVVNGLNYMIEAQTSVGDLHLKIYELERRNVLTLTEATLTLPPQGMSLAMISEALIQEELALDAAAFTASTRQCTGGKVWNDCGSACEPTCTDPAPMCIMMCMARCECPSDKPIWENGSCIARSSCPTTAAAVAPAAAPCVPHNGPCNRMYAPVCAAGVTYANMCLARNACVTEADAVAGRCPEVEVDPAPAASDPPRAGGMMGGMMGGYTAAADIGASSKVHRLASFALTSLQGQCAASNALACGGLSEVSFDHVVSARTQVVAGTNYAIEALTSAGNLHLKIYERVWDNTLEVHEAVLTRPVQPGLLGRSSGNLLEGQELLALDAAAFAAQKLEPLPTLSSAIMIGGALGLGGGHYTGSDAELLSSAAAKGGSKQAGETPPPGRRDTGTQWWLFTFFVLGVVLVASLAAIARRMQRNLKADELPINNLPRSSSAGVEVENIEAQVAKGDESIA